MGAICAITFTETARARLSVALAAINWISILASLVLVAIGTYLKFLVQPFTLLVEKYDDSTLPFLLMGVGGAGVCIQIFGGLVCFFNGDPNNREKRKVLFIPYMILTVVLLLAIFGGAVMCFIHIQHLSGSFKDGLQIAMAKYRDHMALKSKVDELQMQYKCCGSQTYTDWFEVAWVNEEYLNTNDPTVQQHMKSGSYKNDVVPFSCCDPEAVRPCIHEEVHNNKEHFKYDYRTKTTLHTTGCKESLMNYFGKILKEVALVIAGIGLLQMIVLILVRFLQTSIYNAIDDPEAPSQGYLIYLQDKAKSEEKDEEGEEGEEGEGEEGEEQYMEPLPPKHGFSGSFGSFRSHHTYESIPENIYEPEGGYEHQTSVPDFHPPPPDYPGQYMEYEPDY